MLFWADWSEPSKKYGDMLSNVMKDYDHYEVNYIDIDTKSGVAMGAEYGITGVPTTIIKNGSDFKIKVGTVPESTLREELSE